MKAAAQTFIKERQPGWYALSRTVVRHFELDRHERALAISDARERATFDFLREIAEKPRALSASRFLAEGGVVSWYDMSWGISQGGRRGYEELRCLRTKVAWKDNYIGAGVK